MVGIAKKCFKIFAFLTLGPELNLNKPMWGHISCGSVGVHYSFAIK
jgi:hypothetical protein